MSAHQHPQESAPQETPLDTWHQHHAAEGLPQTEHGSHANTRALLVIFAVITVSTVVFSVVIGMFAISQMNRLKGARESAAVAPITDEVVKYKRDAYAQQAGYGWTADGHVRLPIDQAMQMTVAKYQAEHQNDSGEAQGQ